MRTCATGQGGVAARQKLQVIEVGARQTERTLGLDAEQLSVAYFRVAVSAAGVPPHSEYDELSGSISRFW
jgi:hypothetical protein